jgi:hypothetical protein
MFITININRAKKIGLMPEALYQYILLQHKVADNVNKILDDFITITEITPQQAATYLNTLESNGLISIDNNKVSITGEQPTIKKIKRISHKSPVAIITKKDIEKTELNAAIKEALWQFCEMRRIVKKKPVTQLVLKRIINKLKDTSTDMALQAIEKATERQWLDIYINDNKYVSD